MTQLALTGTGLERPTLTARDARRIEALGYCEEPVRCPVCRRRYRHLGGTAFEVQHWPGCEVERVKAGWR